MIDKCENLIFLSPLHHRPVAWRTDQWVLDSSGSFLLAPSLLSSHLSIQFSLVSTSLLTLTALLLTQLRRMALPINHQQALVPRYANFFYSPYLSSSPKSRCFQTGLCDFSIRYVHPSRFLHQLTFLRTIQQPHFEVLVLRYATSPFNSHLNDLSSDHLILLGFR